MPKHNQIHTLGAPYYKGHFRFLTKLKDFKCALWSEKYGKPLIFAFYSSKELRLRYCHREFICIFVENAMLRN